MRQGTSNIQVKQANRNRVFRFINSVERTSMPEIAVSLGMSGPTVLQIVRELTELGVVEEVGTFQSTGGRKAKAIAGVKDFCYALGIDITQNHISLLLINMAREIQKYIRIRKKFSCTETYFSEMGELLEEFLSDSKVGGDKIVGAGISVPGIVDQETERITYSHMLDLRNVDCGQFVRCIPYSCILMNDANAAALAECAKGYQTRDMVYLSLSNSVGGAVVIRQAGGSALGYREQLFGRVYPGSNRRSGEFGHMVIHPNGKKCYCGKNGCLDAYCSALELQDLNDGNLQVFFEELEKGNAECRARWEEYLDDLAIAVDNLRMCFDCDVVLGGYVGGHMEPYLEQLRRRVSESNIFGYEGSYVKACQYRMEASALGAAIYQIEKYIDSI